MKSSNSNFFLEVIDKNSSEVAFIAGTNVFKFGDYGRILEKNKDQLAKLKGQSVVIASLNSEQLCIVLPLLEGIASKIFILPNQMLETDRDAVLEKIDASYQLSLLGENFVLEQQREVQVTGPVVHTAWVLTTSGTTGVPKLIEHTLLSLTKTVVSNVRKKHVWGMFYDLSRFAGLQVFFQSFATASCLILVDTASKLDQQVSFLARNRCDSISATPSLWRMILMSPSVKELTSLSAITLGGEIAQQSVLNSLKSHFPNAKITHIYASTEAGVGFSVRDGLEGFPESWLDGEVMKSLNGLLHVKCKRKNVSGLDIDNDGWLCTGDLINIEDSRVKFLGRDSGAINVGGNKVMPEQVEALLMSNEYVNRSRVFGKKNPIMGNLLKAEVVLTEESEQQSSEILKQLKELCKQELPSYAVPMSIKSVATIDVSASGKVERR